MLKGFFKSENRTVRIIRTDGWSEATVFTPEGKEIISIYGEDHMGVIKTIDGILKDKEW